MAFLLLYSRKNFRQICSHPIPRQMNACMIFQIPIDTCCDAYIIITTHNHFIAFLVKFKKVDR